VVRRILALGEGGRVALGDLPEALLTCCDNGASHKGFFAQRERLICNFERQFLSDLLGHHGGNVADAAREAEIPRGTFYRLIKKHGLAAGNDAC
ncbi:MAG: AAA family ATPase, partial [Planctomycetes bacterium]|nr:AAA family ATPase [Planctomycetota bacterium]